MEMSAVDNGRNNPAGLTLDAILGNAKRTEPLLTHNRTLLDVIRDDRSRKDKKSWKTFRDKLRLKRAGSAWTSSVPVLASDVNVHGDRYQFSRRGSFRSNSAHSTHGEVGGEGAPVSDPPVANSRMQLARSGSVRFGHNPSLTDHDDSADISMPGDFPSSRSFRQPITHHHSSNTPGNDVERSDDDSPVACEGARRLGVALEEERVLSAREAVVAQEAAEAAAAAAAEQASAENNSPSTVAAEEPVMMSLMDLLGEKDRQMGLSGSRYTMGDDDDDYYEDEEEEEVVDASDGIEYTCCVCMVRHKGAAFIPCGHTFCRFCPRSFGFSEGTAHFAMASF